MISFELQFIEGFMHANFYDGAKQLCSIEEKRAPLNIGPHLLIGPLFGLKMSLTKEHAQALIEVLQRFVDKAGT